ncbi:MotE family protein [Phaeovulum sp.]|uniref:MotE family protein n=1 Tax=Phaeovulum sp. TaxID=2934796 RepID=UPI003567468A
MSDAPARQAAIARPAPPKRRRRGGPGTLWVIVVLLASSGLIRIGENTGRAFAASGAPHEAEAVATCEPAPDAGALLNELRRRESVLATREAALESRAQTVALAHSQLELKLAELVAAEDRLAATLAMTDGAAEGDVARLVTVYENMKPKEAAAVFSEMAPEFAAEFLARMRPDAAALVFAGLEPKSAYAISVLIAGRNATAPVQ